MQRIFYVLIILFMTAFSTQAYSASQDQRWWERHDQGWFFYKDPPKEHEKGKDDNKPEKEAMQYQKQELFTKRMQEKGEELLSAALQYPTPENLKRYIQFNKFMMDISQNFAVAWQKTLMQSPELQYDIPKSDAVKDIYFIEKTREEDRRISDLTQRAGLFFFYTSTCPYCLRQAQYLKYFADKYGFAVKAVSLDGGILPEFPESVLDNGISVRLKIDRVPAIFLAFPDDNRFERISTGIVTSGELRRRILFYETKTEPINTADYSSFNY